MFQDLPKGICNAVIGGGWVAGGACCESRLNLNSRFYPEKYTVIAGGWLVGWLVPYWIYIWSPPLFLFLIQNVRFFYTSSGNTVVLANSAPIDPDTAFPKGVNLTCGDEVIFFFFLCFHSV